MRLAVGGAGGRDLGTGGMCLSYSDKSSIFVGSNFALAAGGMVGYGFWMALFKRKVKTVTVDKLAEAVQTRPPIARKKSTPDSVSVAPGADAAALEVGGRQGPEPTRYGDWENKGRCVDF
ncbi:MAG: DUF1674 domain-containing protein [Alphaproteobacteria bacterium]